MKLRLNFGLCLVAIAAAMTGCGHTGGYNLPPASRLMEPGPGVGGPGPGVLSMPAPGVRQIAYEAAAGGNVAPGAAHAAEVQVWFARPEAMQINFDAGGSFDSAPITTPGRQNFVQGGVYRLKVTGVPGREGTELYPTLEIGPPTRQTAAYLAHNAIPVQFTEEDFDQVLSGNFVTKVIYLPDPDFQDLAVAGVETLVSTRLDPGYDPIVEADRRGSIMAVIRIGNKDMEIPGGEKVLPTYGAAGPAANVIPASYSAGTGVQPVGFACDSCEACAAGKPCFDGYPDGNYVSTPRGGYGPGGLPPALAAPGQWGMPITGTPIGLPGPAHVPLGVPAGLKQHVMHNWTHRAIPDPVSSVKINVKQRPGLSYPQPPSRAWVTEETIHSAPKFSNHHFGTAPISHANGAIQADCPDGACASTGLLGKIKGMLGH